MSQRETRVGDYSSFSWDHPVLYRLALLADASDYLTPFVKLVLWIGVTILVYNLVGYALFPDEYLLIPA